MGQYINWIMHFGYFNEKVDNINCYVQSVSDIVIDSIKEGIAYCNRACQHLENKSNTSLSAK